MKTIHRTYNNDDEVYCSHCSDTLRIHITWSWGERQVCPLCALRKRVVETEKARDSAIQRESELRQQLRAIREGEP